MVVTPHWLPKRAETIAAMSSQARAAPGRRTTRPPTIPAMNQKPTKSRRGAGRRARARRSGRCRAGRSPSSDAEGHAEEGDGQQVDGAPPHERAGGEDGRGGALRRGRGGGHDGCISCVVTHREGRGRRRDRRVVPATTSLETRLPTPVLAGSGTRVCGCPHSQRCCAPLSCPTSIPRPVAPADREGVLWQCGTRTGWASPSTTDRR